MSFDQAAFGYRLKEMRKKHGLTQEQLAEAGQPQNEVLRRRLKAASSQ